MTVLVRSNDPLLQPYRLKHLMLKNRIMSTAHEPNYSEDGMPKERYRLYHAEKAKGGIALDHDGGLGHRLGGFAAGFRQSPCL